MDEDNKDIAPVIESPKNISTEAHIILQAIADGYLYEQILTKHPHLNYKSIFAAASEALRLIDSFNTNYKITEIRKKSPQAYKKWSIEEEQQITEKYQTGKSIKEIACQMQRQPGAIRSRLTKLGLIPIAPISESNATHKINHDKTDS